MTDAEKIAVMNDMITSVVALNTNGIWQYEYFSQFISKRIKTVDGKSVYSSNEHSGMSAGDSASSGTLWGQIVGGTAKRDESTKSVGFKATSYGLVMGTDFDVTDEMIAGVALGWIRANNNTSVADAGSDIDTYQAALYGSWTPKSLGGRLHVDGQLGFGYSDTDQSRVIHAFNVRAVADFKGWQTFADVTAGYDFPLGDNAVLTPYAGLRAVHFASDGYTETGAGLLNVTADDYSDNSLRHDIGAKVATSFDSSLGKVTPSLKLGWLHDYGGSPASVTGALGGVTFVSPSSSIAENGLAIGAGIEIAKSDTLTLGFEYDGDLRSDYQSHTGSLKATIRF